MNLSTEQVLLIAPDTATANRAQALANSREWLQFGIKDKTLWGLCKGTGTSPYQIIVDTENMTFKCNCPATTSPCKHSLGLLILYTIAPLAFSAAELPEWVSVRLGKVSNETSNQPVQNETEKAETAVIDEKKIAAKQKRRAERLQLMSIGIKDLSVRLEDLIRSGLIAAANFDYTYWSDFSKRITDAKLSGAGYMIKEISVFLSAGEQERALAKIGELYALVQAFQHIEKLPEALNDDLLITLGVTVKKSEIIEEQQALKDIWVVVGKMEGVDLNNLPFSKTWLWGIRSQKFALVLEYAFDGSFEFNLPEKTCFLSEVVFYPSATPSRVVFKTDPILQDKNALLYSFNYFNSIGELLESYTESLSENPWYRSHPAFLSQVVPAKTNRGISLVDKNGVSINANASNIGDWKLISESGGKKINLFGEWDGFSFVIYSILTAE